jgi:hypothetical protein
MTKLDRLIAELCPDGVKYKTLGDIGEFYPGFRGNRKKIFRTGMQNILHPRRNRVQLINWWHFLRSIWGWCES